MTIESAIVVLNSDNAISLASKLLIKKVLNGHQTLFLMRGWGLGRDLYIVYLHIRQQLVRYLYFSRYSLITAVPGVGLP